MGFVTQHAIERYRERVADLGDEAIRDALSSPAIAKAIEFGAEYVRLPTGQRIVVRDGKVVTVLPADYWRAALDSRERHPLRNQEIVE